MSFADIIASVDDFVWGPVMLILLVGTGIFLTIRLKFLPWRNLGYAIKSTLSKDSRKTDNGKGDVSPFAALMTALAATIGTGNIVGVATAMVAGGPGALVWMWISACFGLTTKFSECMLSLKYRETNAKGEMAGGPMYTMKNGFHFKKVGAVLGMLFAIFAVIASFGIGNMTQANSIVESLNSTFGFDNWIVGIVLVILAAVIILGGIKSISKVTSIVVPCMAIFYIAAGIAVIVCNIGNLPSGIAMIVKMAFSFQAVGGGLCGAITAAIMNAMRYGVARGVFSNEAGMGSAAISAAAATVDDPVRQGYVNMTGTFWDTIVVCSITGLVIASSGALGMTEANLSGSYIANEANTLTVTTTDSDGAESAVDYKYQLDGSNMILNWEDKDGEETLTLTWADSNSSETPEKDYVGTWNDSEGNEYVFSEDGSYAYNTVVKGAALTIAAFKTALGDVGAFLVTIGIAFFAFSTILGWEYQGEKAFEYIFKKPKLILVYRIVFCLVIYVGSVTALDVVWNFADVANALMCVPNLISLIVLSGVIAKEVNRFQPILNQEKALKKAQKKKDKAA